ncbi:kinase/pyrophosphorylase [Acidobacteria bacterium AH-259-D05]|nr:kinase/pyrophosphorylase [Acidobacteria bacterium AH-259-D05]
MLMIFVVSDATGKTAERVVRSALVQFVEAPASVVRRGHVRTPDQLRAVVQEATGHDSVIVHTLVSDELRSLMLAESRSHGVDAMDLMGPVLDRLATHLKLTPQEKPGLFSQLVEAQQRQIEAVEFAFRHDDGQHADELSRAEVVLVGISRTMKTPTTLHLSYQGWFAANVPIVPEIPLPSGVLSLPVERVFCFVMAPSRLLELRRVRADHLGIPAEPYASLENIRQELRHSQRLGAKHGWRQLDVTGKSVEEVAHEIVLLLPGKDQGRRPLWEG